MIDDTKPDFIIHRNPPNGRQHLDPCPFCGSDEIVYWSYPHLSGPRWKVLCTNCMAGIDPGWAQSKEPLTELWNRRQA